MELKKIKINYNEKDQSIEINDSYRTQYFIVNTMLALNILNSILYPFFVLDKEKLEMSWFIWLIVGLSSVILIIYQITKKSAEENLQLSKIHSLHEKNFLGREILSLKLNNGKFRDILIVKSETDKVKIKSFFKDIGFQV